MAMSQHEHVRVNLIFFVSFWLLVTISMQEIYDHSSTSYQAVNLSPNHINESLKMCVHLQFSLVTSLKCYA